MQLGGAEEAFREIEVELDGMKLLDCLNNKVYEASGRQGKAIKKIMSQILKKALINFIYQLQKMQRE